MDEQQNQDPVEQGQGPAQSEQPEQSEQSEQTPAEPTPIATPEEQTQPAQTEPAAPAYTTSKTNWIKQILIYALIGLVVYGVIWYFFLRGSASPY